MTGPLSQELVTPADFEQVVPMVSEEMLTAKVVCGPDVDRHVGLVAKYAEAGRA